MSRYEVSKLIEYLCFKIEYLVFVGLNAKLNVRGSVFRYEVSEFFGTLFPKICI